MGSKAAKEDLSLLLFQEDENKQLKRKRKDSIGEREKRRERWKDMGRQRWGESDGEMGIATERRWGQEPGRVLGATELAGTVPQEGPPSLMAPLCSPSRVGTTWTPTTCSAAVCAPAAASRATRCPHTAPAVSAGQWRSCLWKVRALRAWQSSRAHP